MKIFVGTDHAGFELKEHLVSWLKDNSYEVEDMGAHNLDPEDDYPDFVGLVARAVSENPENHKGIVLGGSGQGEAIVCNRYKDVRAAVFYGGNLEIVKLSRGHNNANVLSLGARFLGKEEAEKALKLWLETSFGNEERHARRISKIDS